MRFSTILRIIELHSEKRRIMAFTIRPDFLPPQLPPNAKSNIIDFTSTKPAIPKYKDHFAAVIDNFMTEAECNELLSYAEQSATKTSISNGNATKADPWERAMINVGGGRQAMAADYRNCGRIIYDAPELADRIFARLMPFFRQWNMVTLENRYGVTGLAGRRYVYQVRRLNERLRFLKYAGGEFFRPHCDASYHTPDESQISFYTIQLYLNNDGEEGQNLDEVMTLQDKERKGEYVFNAKETDTNGKLLGGATSFMPSWEEDHPAVKVWPKTGRVLVFQHNNLWHSGDSVYSGTKYTVRTDVMYSMHRFN